VVFLEIIKIGNRGGLTFQIFQKRNNRMVRISMSVMKTSDSTNKILKTTVDRLKLIATTNREIFNAIAKTNGEIFHVIANTSGETSHMIATTSGNIRIEATSMRNITDTNFISLIDKNGSEQPD